MGPQLIFPLIVSCAGWCAGWLVLGRTRRCEDSQVDHPRSVSIIIPARDEAKRLPTLLNSIHSQSNKPLETIVVDDHSTDATANVAHDLGAIVLPAPPLPDGWRGKTWACQGGANIARGELLLFLDADTWLATDGLRKIFATFDQQKLGALSIGPHHVTDRPHEQLSAFFNLVMTAGIGAFTLWPREPEGLFGQSLLIDRATYTRVGGHERVRGKILENLWLARELKAMDIPIACRTGGGTISMRMYPDSLSELVAGWGKAFASGASVTAPVILFLIILWLSGVVTATVMLLQSFNPFSILIYAIFVLQITFLLHRVGSFRFYTALFFPLPLLTFFIIFGKSILARSRRVKWKGRVIHAD